MRVKGIEFTKKQKNRKRKYVKPKHKTTYPIYIYCSLIYIYYCPAYIYINPICINAKQTYIYYYLIYIYCSPTYIYTYPICIYSSPNCINRKPKYKSKRNGNKDANKKEKLGHHITAVSGHCWIFVVSRLFFT